MKKLISFFCFCFLLATPILSQTSYNMRVLLHGVKNISDSNLGIGAWIVAPNMTSATDKWFVVVGPRYNGDNFWIEMMAGTFMQKGVATPLIDIRHSSVDGIFSRFLNVQWIDPGKENSIYVFYSIDYSLPLIKDVGVVGIETEDTLTGKNETMSVGPHVVIPFGKSVLVMAYQFHLYSGRSNQVWMRMIVNF